MFTEKRIYFTLAQMIFLKSRLLFFASKCVMWGRVNIVGHDITFLNELNMLNKIIEIDKTPQN